MRKLSAAIAVIAASLALAVLVLPRVVPQDYVRERINTVLARSSGLRLEKTRHIALSLFPPGLTVEGAVVTLPPRALAPAVRAERIFAAVRPSSILGKRLTVSRVVITRPRIMIRDSTTGLNGDGAVRLAVLQNSDILSDDTPLAARAMRPRLVKLPTADIEVIDGTLQPAGARHIHLLLHRPEENGPALLTGTMQVQGEEIRLEASAAEPDGANAAAPVQVRIRSRAFHWTLNGTLSLRRVLRFSGATRLEVQSGPALAAWLGGAKVLASLDRSAFDGRVEISPVGLTLANARITAPGADGVLDAGIDFGGKAHVTLKTLSLHGGRGHGRVTLDTTEPGTAVLSGVMEVSNVDALALSTSVSSFDWISGRANASVQFAGGGRTLAEIAGTLTGRARVSVTHGALEGLDLPLIVTRVNEGEFGKWRREPGRRTEFDSFSATFTLNKGVASTRDMTLTGRNVTATGEGEASIPEQRLNYRLRTKVTARAEASAEGGKAAALDLPLVVKGDWRKPDIRPDVSRALEDKDALAANAKLLGKSVEKLTNGKVKATDFRKTIDALFGRKKKTRDKTQE